jgi:hypothetical protein
MSLLNNRNLESNFERFFITEENREFRENVLKLRKNIIKKSQKTYYKGSL